MKAIILNELKEKGIFINNQLLSESEKDNLKKDFEIKKNSETFKINNDLEIRKISKTLFEFLQRDYVKNSIYEYFGTEFKCSTILFTRTKPEIKKNDSDNIFAGSLLGFHNDDKGKQIATELGMTAADLDTFVPVSIPDNLQDDPLLSEINKLQQSLDVKSQQLSMLESLVRGHHITIRANYLVVR